MYILLLVYSLFYSINLTYENKLVLSYYLILYQVIHGYPLNTGS